MIESYQLEITRKRRAARLFWLIVLVCAFFLYYFFQGYYPDVSLGMRRIFSDSGSQRGSSGSSDLIKSFGIINVKTTPTDTTILLGSGTYSNNEKRMSDYGDYRMHITGSGYLANTMEFKIDREKPFFIEKVSLLPSPQYRIIPTAKKLYQITDDTYIIQAASGLMWSGSTMSGRVNHSGSLDHIGGKYFKTNTTILRWEIDKFMLADEYITNYIRTCPQVAWVYELFYCPQVQSILTQGHQYMTGVLDIRGYLISRNESITEITSGNIGKSWNQTGAIDLTEIVLIDGGLYMSSGGILIPQDPRQDIIVTTLDSIRHVSSIGDEMVFVGEIGGEPHLIIRNFSDPIDRTRDISLPRHLSYRDIGFYSLDGNIIFETTGGVLFVYRGSSELHWLVEGEILSYDKSGTAYRKDGKIWWADWSEK